MAGVGAAEIHDIAPPIAARLLDEKQRHGTVQERGVEDVHRSKRETLLGLFIAGDSIDAKARDDG